MKFSEEIAKISLETGAIRLEAETPFLWASGYRMPIYNDNRLLLGNSQHRQLIAEGFKDVITCKEIEVDVIAGTATAGIPPATSLANLLETPLIYVRPHPKEHGMKNQIEGILRQNQNVVVVEDLISTGRSALKAVAAIRKAGGNGNDLVFVDKLARNINVSIIGEDIQSINVGFNASVNGFEVGTVLSCISAGKNNGFVFKCNVVFFGKDLLKNIVFALMVGGNIDRKNIGKHAQYGIGNTGIRGGCTQESNQ